MTCCFTILLVSLRGENEFDPNPQNENLVPFMSFLKISDNRPCQFYMGVPLGGGGGGGKPWYSAAFSIHHTHTNSLFCSIILITIKTHT